MRRIIFLIPVFFRRRRYSALRRCWSSPSLVAIAAVSTAVVGIEGMGKAGVAYQQHKANILTTKHFATIPFAVGMQLRQKSAGVSTMNNPKVITNKKFQPQRLIVF